jgi:hypothetical protein
VVLGDAVREHEVEDVLAAPAVPQSRICAQKASLDREGVPQGSEIGPLLFRKRRTQNTVRAPAEAPPLAAVHFERMQSKTRVLNALLSQ